MPKKPTGVRKRGNTWQYYFDKASIDGKRQTVYRSGFKTQKEAEAARAEAIAKYNNGGFVPLDTNISLADFVKIFINDLKENRSSLNTIANTESSIDTYLLRLLGGYRVTDINQAVINQFINHLTDQGLAPNTIKYHCKTAKKLFDAAKRHKIITENPFDSVRIPDSSVINSGRPNYAYEDSTIQKLFDAYRQNSCITTVLMLGYYAGLRVSEMCGLTWNDVDFTNNTLTVNKQLVRQPKTRKNYMVNPKYNSKRKIEMPDVLVDYLKGLSETRNNNQKYILNQDGSIKEGNDFQFVLVNDHGKATFRQNITKKIYEYSQRGYPAFKPHDLRHTHCTKLIDSGFNMQYVQKRLGHKSLKTTLDIYTHLTASRRSKEAEKLNSTFFEMTSF